MRKILLSFRLAKRGVIAGTEKSPFSKKLIVTILFMFIMNSAFSQTNTIDSITSLLKTDKEDTNKINHLNELGREFMYQNPDTAILLCKQALELASSVHFDKIQGWTKGIVNSNNSLGNCNLLKGDYPNALECFFKALKINEELGDKNGMASSLSNVGNVYYYQADYDNALVYYIKSLKLDEDLENKNGIAVDLGLIGNTYYSQGVYAKALEYYFKALELDEELERKNGTAGILGNIGNVYQDQGDYSKALGYYFKSLKLHEYLENKNGIAGNLVNIGILYISQKKYKDAEEYLLKALANFTEVGELEGIKESNEFLSNLYSQTGQYQLAYEHYKLFTTAKDSLFNEDKSKEIGRLEMQHEIEIAELERERKEEEDLKIKTQKTERRNLLEYSGMVIGLIIIGLFVALLGFVKVKPWVAEGITFFVFLLFFEFILVLLDPYIDKFTKGEPAYKLFINAGVALCIFPLHAFFEKMLKRKLMKK